MATGAIPVIFAGRRPMPDVIRIGMREDNEVETIRFALPTIGSGQNAYLYMTLPGGGGDVVNITGGVMTITRTHTAVPGVIDAHVEITIGQKSWHSEPLRLTVGDTTRGGEQVEQTYPSAIADALARANAAAWRAESATGAGAPPIISTAEGVASVAADSADSPLRGLTVYGKTTQDGTPGEDAPVGLESVGNAGNITLTVEDMVDSDDIADNTKTATISTAEGLRGVPVSGGDVTYTDADGQGWIADTVEYDAQTGTAQLVRRVASVTYDGNASEGWVKGGSNSYFAIRNADKSSASHGLCTHYQGLAINAGESMVGFTAATDASYIRFRPAGYADMTVDAWREQLNASPVTVLYALAVPEMTPITGDELAALTALRSLYPSTTVFNDAGAQMAVRYVADSKTYVDDANAELAQDILAVDDELDDLEKIVGLENITDNFDWDWQSGYISSDGLYKSSANFKRSNVSYVLEKNDVIAVKTKGYQTKVSIISTVESVITPAVISLDSDVHLYIYRANCHKRVRLSVSVSDYKILLYKANPTSLLGKTVLNYGDSIAYGAGNSGEGYADILAGKYGMTVIDRSASGATMRTGVDGHSWISGRVINDVTNNYTPDIVLLEGGFNDVYNQSGDWIGALSDGYDVSSLVTTNLYGALEKSLNAVKTYYPTAKALFVITPKIKTSFYPVWDGAANDKFNTVRKAIIECCEKWSVEYVDLFTVSDFNSALSKYLAYTKDSDGVHPTRDGYDLFYVPYIERRLGSIKDGLK